MSRGGGLLSAGFDRDSFCKTSSTAVFKCNSFIDTLLIHYQRSVTTCVTWSDGVVFITPGR